MKGKGLTQDSAMVRQAFDETLGLLGERTKRAIIIDLECAGEYDRNRGNISFEKLVTGLYRILGAEATELIIEKSFIKLEELAVIAKR